MRGSWLQLLKKSYVIALSIVPLSRNILANCNRIRKPGGQLTDTSFYQLNENGWLEEKRSTQISPVTGKRA